MSKKLLEALNGNRKGLLSQWLSRCPESPRIAWYPSAGEDFRAMLYLHPRFAQFSPASAVEPPPPDIFIYTDYYPWKSSTFLDTPIVHKDQRTIVTVKSIEELPGILRPELGLDRGVVDFPEGSSATGRVLFMEVEICSDKLGTFSFPMIYVFAENAAFYANRAIPNQARFSHIIHVRYGNGFGGGQSSGVWLLNILKQAGCEVFVSDGAYNDNPGDRRVEELYPALGGNHSNIGLTQIRTLNGQYWSDVGQVVWNLLSGTESAPV